VRRRLAGSAYNERRAACERAAEALRALAPGLRSLRDADPDLLERGRDRLDGVDFRRASHVVAEIPRPRLFAEALANGDLAEAGRLMDASHASLRDLYEVSCDELDTIVEAARAQAGCFGARMTGAGFGGCAVALVAAAEAPSIAEGTREAYRRRTGREATIVTCRPAAGACLLDEG